MHRFTSRAVPNDRVPAADGRAPINNEVIVSPDNFCQTYKVLQTLKYNFIKIISVTSVISYHEWPCPSEQLSTFISLY